MECHPKRIGQWTTECWHHMDVYASSTDDILEDEEHYADQLKEYFFSPRRSVPERRMHELMQFD